MKVEARRRAERGGGGGSYTVCILVDFVSRASCVGERRGNGFGDAMRAGVERELVEWS